MSETDQPVARGLFLLGMATMLANGAAYLLSMIGARALSVPDYGALGSLLSISVIGSTVALAAQAVAARQSAPAGTRGPAAVRDTASLSLGATIAMLVIGVGLVIPLASVLEIPVVAALLSCAAMAASVPGFAALGILQGREDHRGFGLAYSGIGLLRAAGGVAAMLLVPTVSSACLGIFIGSLVGSALSMLIAKLPVTAPQMRGPLTRELLHNSSALVALFAFANSDVLMARIFLAPHSSGEYAVGALIAKVAFFLPYAIITMYFPKMNATDGKGRAFTVALSLTGAVNVAVTVGCYVLREPLVWVLAGDKYADLAPLAWIFALAGGIFAVMQVVLYAGFPARAKVVGLVPLAALSVQVLVVVLWAHGTVLHILLVTIVTASVATIIGGWIEGRSLGSATAHGGRMALSEPTA